MLNCTTGTAHSEAEERNWQSAIRSKNTNVSKIIRPCSCFAQRTQSGSECISGATRELCEAKSEQLSNSLFFSQFNRFPWKSERSRWKIVQMRVDSIVNRVSEPWGAIRLKQPQGFENLLVVNHSHEMKSCTNPSRFQMEAAACLF